MGFRYRKSINLGGGFRINISKSGVGYSFGTKGYRITKTAKGTIRRTTSIPGTGISFVNETPIKRKSKKHISNSTSSQSTDVPPEIICYDTKEITNAKASELRSAELDLILTTAQKSLTYNRISNIGIGVSLFLGFGYPLFFLAFIFFCICKILIQLKGRVELDYVIDSEQENLVKEHMKPILNLTSSKKVWRIVQSSKVLNRKYAAGASDQVKRTSCVARKVAPFPFKVNTSAASFSSGYETLIFLPDCLFVIQKNKIGALNYSDIIVSKTFSKFVEDESVPKDSTVIGRTWRYVNKSGGPDRRFNNNRELPVCLYGELQLKSESGLNTILMFSNADLVSDDWTFSLS